MSTKCLASEKVADLILNDFKRLSTFKYAQNKDDLEIEPVFGSDLAYLIEVGSKFELTGLTLKNTFVNVTVQPYWTSKAIQVKDAPAEVLTVALSETGSKLTDSFSNNDKVLRTIDRKQNPPVIDYYYPVIPEFISEISSAKVNVNVGAPVSLGLLKVSDFNAQSGSVASDYVDFFFYHNCCLLYGESFAKAFNSVNFNYKVECLKSLKGTKVNSHTDIRYWLCDYDDLVALSSVGCLLLSAALYALCEDTKEDFRSAANYILKKNPLLLTITLLSFKRNVEKYDMNWGHRPLNGYIPIAIKGDLSTFSSLASAGLGDDFLATDGFYQNRKDLSTNLFHLSANAPKDNYYLAPISLTRKPITEGIRVAHMINSLPTGHWVLADDRSVLYSTIKISSNWKRKVADEFIPLKSYNKDSLLKFPAFISSSTLREDISKVNIEKDLATIGLHKFSFSLIDFDSSELSTNQDLFSPELADSLILRENTTIEDLNRLFNDDLKFNWKKLRESQKLSFIKNKTGSGPSKEVKSLEDSVEELAKFVDDTAKTYDDVNYSIDIHKKALETALTVEPKSASDVVRLWSPILFAKNRFFVKEKNSEDNIDMSEFEGNPLYAKPSLGSRKRVPLSDEESDIPSDEEW